VDATPGLFPKVAAAEPARLAGIVLAGGQSGRLGRDKATLLVPEPVGQSRVGRSPAAGNADGALTLVEHIVGVISQRCQPVFVMAAPGQRLPAVQAQVVRDETRGGGPLSATGQGLRAAAAAGSSRAFVSAVDLPFLDAALIDQLWGLAEQVDADVVLPWDGQDHYLAAVYRTALAERIEALLASGERTMRALGDTVDVQRLVVAGGQSLATADSAADFQSLAAAGR
jgi:molybdopterin-guanine dinucleotide biosynthesis protein A